MLGEGVQRGTITYNAAISACEKSGQLQQALELFGRIPGEGVRRDTITHSAAINACEKGGQWKQTLEIAKECRAKVCSETLPPTVPSKECSLNVCSETLSLSHTYGSV